MAAANSAALRKGPASPVLGAHLTDQGVIYCTWSPEVKSIAVEITPRGGGEGRLLQMERDAEGYHTVTDREGAAGDCYKYRIEGRGAFPDPASRAQLATVHGPSIVVDPQSYTWNDGGWQRPRFRDVIIYELHIGTFTPAGTFRAAIEKLPELRELGINAIELMPIADFPGERNWGYDGVLIYAPARVYGSPDDLRALVDAAHQQGIAVLLDVVYNHLGPDGNYLPTFSSHFFNPEHHTPWGSAFNFDGQRSQPVRNFFGRNPLYWMEEFHIDGFRFDATHEIVDESGRHIFEEITETIHARGGYAVAEDSRNEARMLVTPQQHGYGFDGVWADDFHHVIRVSQIKERESYFRDFEGSLAELVETLQHGWLYRGQASTSRGEERGTECRHVSPSHFVHCISNHDQTGNRAMGERLNHLIDPAAYRAVSALLCLTPYTPMLFMGQEWAASTPFCYFTDHNDQLGPLVTEGRRREFSAFEAFQNEAARKHIPDPQQETTFTASKLNWEERQSASHAAVLRLYVACLKLRNSAKAFRPETRATWRVGELGSGAGALRLEGGGEFFLVIFNLTGAHTVGLGGESLAALPDGQKWIEVVSSQDAQFGGDGSGLNEAKQCCDFNGAETLVLQSRSA